MSSFAIQIAAPYISVDEYARVTGIPAETVKKMIRDGRVPIRPKDKPKEKPLINVLALMQEAHNNSYAA